MSPILDLQMRMRELGRIRMGDKGAKGEPKKLTKFRLTSASRAILEAAAADPKIGGTVKDWEGAPADGYYELYTDTDQLEIVLPPTFSDLDGTPSAPFSQWYEHWTGAGCQRRCDGVTETIKGKPCSCNPDERECKITTRISFMLPGLPDIGVWRLDTHGFYAAIETPGTLEILRRAANGRDFIPATLRMEQRTKKTPGGPVRKFVVPIVELRQSIMELASGEVTGTLAINAPAGVPARPALPPSPEPEAGEFDRPAAPELGAPPPLPTPVVAFAAESDVTAFLELAARVSPEDHDKAVEWLAAERDKNPLNLVPVKRLAAASKRLLTKVPA